VVGAHLSGEPLNHELTNRGAVFVRACRTASEYRLYALPNTTPPKPGLVRDPAFIGSGIEIEVWSLDRAMFGTFVDAVPAPLAIGTVTLDDDTEVNGFVCEPYAVQNATEITEYGGWRRYMKARSALP
jgi:allophanate hydrolase